MNQVLVAACVGVMAGWMGFGWVLAEAPVDGGAAQVQVAATPSLQSDADVVRLGGMMEPNQRG